MQNLNDVFTNVMVMLTKINPDVFLPNVFAVKVCKTFSTNMTRARFMVGRVHVCIAFYGMNNSLLAI